MKTILVPTDFSSTAQHAADYAAALCRELQANLILFHAYLLPLALGEVPLVMVTGDELRNSSEEGLKKEAQRLSAVPELKIECIARMGMAMDEIKELVKERNVDLVIMGSKETAGLDKLFGSTTNSAINNLKKRVYQRVHQAGKGKTGKSGIRFRDLWPPKKYTLYLE